MNADHLAKMQAAAAKRTAEKAERDRLEASSCGLSAGSLGEGK